MLALGMKLAVGAFFGLTAYLIRASLSQSGEIKRAVLFLRLEELGSNRTRQTFTLFPH
jgi:hypothetical protein